MPEKAGMEQLWMECDMEDEADVQNHMGQGGEHIQPLVAALVVADNKVLGVENLFVAD